MNQVRNTKQSHITLQLGEWGRQKLEAGRALGWQQMTKTEIAFPFQFSVSSFHFRFPFPVSISFPFPAFPYALNSCTNMQHCTHHHSWNYCCLCSYWVLEHTSYMFSLTLTMSGEFSASGMFKTPALELTLQAKASSSFFQLGTPHPVGLPS